MNQPNTIESFFSALESWKQEMEQETVTALKGLSMPRTYWEWQSRRAVYDAGIKEYDTRTRHTFRGIALAQKLLEQREQIEEWIISTAATQMEARQSDAFLFTGDWDALLDSFAPEYREGLKQLPYYGDVNEQLHRVLDQLALGRQVRSYEY